MSKPALRRGWLKSALRNVLTNARTSVVVTVALLPSLLAQVFLYFDNVSPLRWIVILSGFMIIVFLGLLQLEWRAQPKDASGFISGTLHPDQLSLVHGLVTVVSRMEDTGMRPVHALIQGLPNLKVVHCVTCRGVDGVGQLRLLRQWAEQHHRALDIRPLHTTPDRLWFDETQADSLARELALIPHGNHVIVDVTADTKPMTLTLYLAAVQQDLPVTYFPSTDPDRPGQAFALSVIRDPNGLFSPQQPPAD